MQLETVFHNTLSADQSTRQSAESYLKSAVTSEDFIRSCFELISSSSVLSETKLAASLFIKNYIIRYWSSNEHISSSVRHYYVHNVLHSCLLRLTDYQPLDVLSLTLTHISKADTDSFHAFQSQMLSLLPQLNSSPSLLLAGTLCFRRLAKAFEFAREGKSSLINSLCRGYFPFYLDFCLNNYGKNDPFVFKICNLVFKSINSLNKIFLHEYFLDQSVLLQWCATMSAFVRIPLTSSKDQKELSDTLSQIFNFIKNVVERYLIIEKVKKTANATTLIHLVFNGNQSFIDQLDLSIKNLIGHGWSSSILTFLEHSTPHILNSSITDDLVTSALTCIDFMLKFKETWVVVKPLFPSLFNSLLFPLLQFRKSDIELFHDDPQEFLRSQSYSFDSERLPAQQVGDVLITSIKKRAKTSLPIIGAKVFGFLNQSHGQNQSEIDGILALVSLLAGRIQKKSVELPNQMTVSDLLSRLVLPILDQSNHHSEPVIYRALFVIKQFSPNISNFGPNIEPLLFSIANYLTCQNFPIKVEATSVFQNFLNSQDSSFKPQVDVMVKKFIDQFLSSLFVILDEYASPDVTETISLIICNYPAECEPLACKIVEKLVASFESTLANAGVTMNDLIDDLIGDSMIEKVSDSCESSLMEILRALINLFDCFGHNSDLFSTICDPFSKFLTVILKGHFFELFDLALSLSTHVSANAPVPFSPVVWNLFDSIVNSFDLFAFDYLPSMVISIDNFMVRDPFNFSQRPNCKSSIELIYKKCFLTEYLIGWEEKSACVKIIQSYLINVLKSFPLQFPGFVEVIVDDLLSITNTRRVIERRRHDKLMNFEADLIELSPSYELNLIVTIALLISIDCNQTMSALSSLGNTRDRITSSLSSLGQLSETEVQVLNSVFSNSEAYNKNQSIATYAVESIMLSFASFKSHFSRIAVIKCLVTLLSSNILSNHYHHFLQTLINLLKHIKTSTQTSDPNPNPNQNEQLFAELYDRVCADDLTVNDAGDEVDATENAFDYDHIPGGFDTLIEELEDCDEDDLTAFDNEDPFELVRNGFTVMSERDGEGFSKFLESIGGSEALEALLN
ncbi:hypothetical protein P9112_005430 [Eukaryota sp. TZLM1-RC]